MSSPNEQNEQSLEVLPDGHIKATAELKIIRNSCRDKCEKRWQQCKSTRNTDHPPTDGLFDMKRGSFLVSEVVKCSPHSIEPFADHIVENLWSLEQQLLHIFQKSERDLEIPHQNWQTDGNPACGWERATSQTNTLSEQTMELCMREVHDDSQRTTGQKRTSRQSSRPHRSRGRYTIDDAADPRVAPEVHEHESQNQEPNENDDEDGETPNKPDDEDHEMEEETLPEPDTAATSSSSRGEKRTETQENVFVKRRLMAKSPKRPITLVPPPEDPVKRRLLKKTDMRNDESVMNVDENLLNVVNTLTKDENMPKANSNEDNEMPKLTVLDDYEEMMQGRQKELKSLKEMGAMTVVKRSEA